LLLYDSSIKNFVAIQRRPYELFSEANLSLPQKITHSQKTLDKVIAKSYI
jgi:hypothetical protein